MVNKDKRILEHIKRYCIDIETFIKRFGKDYDIFVSDRAYFNAVSMCILQIGELSGSLSEEYRKKTSKKIPWTNIKGMRNMVAHEYGALDEELVWETATEDIPVLFDFCLDELENINNK